MPAVIQPIVEDDARDFMKNILSVLMIFALACSIGFAQENDTEVDTQTNITSSEGTIQSPWAENSKICIFVREWILKGMFLVVFLVFLTGVATISGAAFPQWRDYGSKMILGSIGAMVLYILGTQALRFFMDTSICGL